MEVNRVAFLVKAADDLKEALRSAAGLGVEDRTVAVFLMDLDLTPYAGDEAFRELLELLGDLQIEVFTNRRPDFASEPIRYASLEEMGALIGQHDLAICFGGSGR
ncbi:MAG: hypothetical protein AB1641_11680 [Thermodesulfobacteriota bacterium]